MQWSQKYLPDQLTKDKYKQLENIAKEKGVKIWLGAPSILSTPSYAGDRKKYQAKVRCSNTAIHDILYRISQVNMYTVEPR